MKNQSKHSEMTTHPGTLLDALLLTLALPDDAALASRLDLAPRIIKLVREGRLLISQSMLLQMHAASGLSLGALEDMLRGTGASAWAEPQIE